MWNFIFDQYLTPALKQKMETTLKKNPELFGGGLVKLKDCDNIHIELMDNAIAASK